MPGDPVALKDYLNECAMQIILEDYFRNKTTYPDDTEFYTHKMMAVTPLDSCSGTLAKVNALVRNKNTVL